MRKTGTLVANGLTLILCCVGTQAYGKESSPAQALAVPSQAAMGAATQTSQVDESVIASNERSAISVCNGFVEAQTDYASEERDGQETGIYAAKIGSDPGKHNGLYWPTANGEPPSPVGEDLAAAEDGRGEGNGHVRKPYHGYYYRMLLSQGANANGGALDYFVKGKLTEGVALLAWPAEYGVTGTKTFMVNHEGIVYEKDLGKNTGADAANIKTFNPDSSWVEVDVVER